MPDNKAHINSLTGARFFAAMMVLLYHTNLVTNYPFIGVIFAQGSIGVSFFYILSGFILTYTYYDWFNGGVGITQYKTFIQARFARIYPMHVVALLIAAPIMLYFICINPGLVDRVLNVTLTPALLVYSWIANLLLVQIYIPKYYFSQLWNEPNWSIACEFFFYIFFPFIIARLLRRFSRCSGLLRLSAILFLASAVLYVSGVALIWSYPQYFWGDNAAMDVHLFIYRFPVFRIPEFMIGCALGAFYLKGEASDVEKLSGYLKNRPNRDLILLFSLLLIILITLIHFIMMLAYRVDLCNTLLSTLYEKSHLYLLYIVPFSLIILCLSFGKNILSPILEHPYVVLLGEASYSLYITHMIGIEFILWSQRNGAVFNDFVILGAILGIVLLSVPFYKYVETPMRYALRGRAIKYIKEPQELPA